MSHFTVLVIGENPEKQLQPYHEYECTGIEDEYVINVDKTEEVNEWLQQQIFVGNTLSEGKWDYEYNEDRAKQNLEGYKAMTRIDYFALAELDTKEQIDDNFGYKYENGKYFRYTNPNAKWDWYSLGGRWTGFFRLKDDGDGEIGEPGIMTARAKVGYADSAYKKDIDFDFMRKEKMNSAAHEYNAAMKIIGDLPINETWEVIRESGVHIDEARKKYWEQPRCKAWNENEKRHNDFGFSSSPDDYLISKEQFIKNASDSAIATFAVVKDSKWYERGKMGWFAFVSNEKDKDEWNNEFTMLLDSLPDDTLLSVYDCHI